MDFRIAADHPSLAGHFPGRPIVPGVVLLDRVCAAIAAAHGAPPTRWPQVKFLQPLLPEQDARVELEPIKQADAAPRWRFRVLRVHDGALLARGEAARA